MSYEELEDEFKFHVGLCAIYARAIHILLEKCKLTHVTIPSEDASGVIVDIQDKGNEYVISTVLHSDSCN
jgi:hypothetical protein